MTNAIKSNVDRVAEKIRQKAERGSLAASVKVVEAYYERRYGKGGMVYLLTDLPRRDNDSSVGGSDSLLPR